MTGGVYAASGGTESSFFVEFEPGAGQCTFTHVSVPGARDNQCEISVCPAYTAHPMSAGLITLTAPGTQAMSLQPMADGTYPVEAGSKLWQGGEDFSLVVAGNPPSIAGATSVLKAPIDAANMGTLPSMVDRTAAMTFTWTYDHAKPVVDIYFNVQLATMSPTGGVTPAGISCEFPLVAGSATIPAGALAKVPAGADQLSMQTQTQQTVTTTTPVSQMTVFSLISSVANGTAAVTVR